METAKSIRLGFLIKLTCLSMLLSAFVGCQQDPVQTLKRAGVEFQRDDIGLVSTANFPADTTDELLEAAGKVTTLTEVNLANTQISDEGLEKLGRLKRLEVLDLSNTSLSNASLKHIKKLEGLRELDLSATEVTGEKIAEELKDLSRLQQLRIAKLAEPEQPDPRSWKDAIKLGIDLKGGTNLIYQVDTEKAEGGKNVDASIDKMVGAIIKRVNPSGTEEVVVRRIGSDRIEVIIPGVDPETVAEIKLKIIQLGSLEFEILANQRDHSQIITNARQLNSSERDYYEGSRLKATWRDVGDGQVVAEFGDVAARDVKVGDNTIRQLLVMVTGENERVTGQYLVKASQEINERGELAVGFTFDQRGTYLFTNLTSANRPALDGQFKRRLAIILDGKVHSAPNIIETIGQRGQISGNFTQKEVDRLIDVLNAGALEIPMVPDPINELTISPLLGADVQQKGITAIILASAAVVVFMLVYYRFAGIVANICLLLNLVLVMGMMALIQGTFTLPGLAGLVLTIGMAVDANVLIFERIREESNRGSSLRMAIQNGFGRAFTTIVDANVTTLIVAVVLFMIGTDQVKGFAVTLFIGIVMSMFSALYCGRLIFDLFERKSRAKGLSMMSIVGSTEFDFIGKKSIAAIVSAILIVCGMGSLFTRGADNLDIDFRGGSMVTFEFVNDAKLDDVRAELEKELGTGITIERITRTGEDQSSDVGKRYRLRTTEDDVGAVREKVSVAFDDSELELNKVEMAFTPVEEIPVPEKKDGEEAPSVVSGFEGGSKSTLTLTSELTEVRVADYLKAAISGTTDEFDDPASLFALKGTKGSGTEKGALSTKPYSEFELSVRPALSSGALNSALLSMQETMKSSPNFDEVNKFAKSVGVEMQSAALIAMLVSLAAIVAYIWFRFQRITFGLAAVAALVHDVLVVLGMVALASYLSGNGFGQLLMLNDFKINLPMIAAFLTIVGYSLNDTIVVFDRIREVRGKNPALTNTMVNVSLNQTLARTLLTSFTTFLVVIILYIRGGEGIHGFAFCLVLGVIVGTYSSIYVASPVLLWLMNRSSGTTQAAT